MKNSLANFIYRPKAFIQGSDLRRYQQPMYQQLPSSEYQPSSFQLTFRPTIGIMSASFLLYKMARPVCFMKQMYYLQARVTRKARQFLLHTLRSIKSLKCTTCIPSSFLYCIEDRHGPISNISVPSIFHTFSSALTGQSYLQGITGLQKVFFALDTSHTLHK